ncbi:hypothetical protein J7M22_16985 [Candidatus Poribacteria bacterium]|nr:hypothetical protein [Candidatus Poribacteria bacterium]
MLWIGPDGTGIETVPMLEGLRSGWGIKPPSPETVKELERAGVEKPLFSFLFDFTPQWVPSSERPEVRGVFGGGWANVCKRLNALELRGRELLFSGRIRARKPGAHIYIDAHDEKGRAKAGVQSRNVPPDGAWHEVEITWRVPEDALYIFPQGRIVSVEGDADFKDLSLKLLPEGKELLSGFPEGWSIGRSEGVEVEEEFRKGCVRLRMKGRSVKIDLVTLEEYFELVGEPRWSWTEENKLLADLFQNLPFLLRVVSVPPCVHLPPEPITPWRRGKLQRQHPDKQTYLARLRAVRGDGDPAAVEARWRLWWDMEGQPEGSGLTFGYIHRASFFEERRQSSDPPDDPYVHVLRAYVPPFALKIAHLNSNIL